MLWEELTYTAGQAIHSQSIDLVQRTQQFTLTTDTCRFLQAQVYSTQTESIILENSLQLNQWYHIAFVLSGTTGFIYVNGRQGATGTLSLPRNVQRTRNYIGKSNWPEANADAVYDDLKIYNETLEATDILNEYILTSNYGKIFLYFIYLKFLNHYYITKPLDYILNITFSV